jgi:hypothetical protein
VAEVARRRDVSRAQICQWRAELGGDGRSMEAGRDIVGFVPVEVAAPHAPERRAMAAPGPDRAREVVEVGLAGGRSLRVPSSLPTAELRRLIRAVEGA